ncbi:MAG: hypothetical protein DMF59_12735 [Acidobacteria bacterium]|nr:MAG: hypothetical protein DMF59_12735 [Acidobacteriota bacterium]
MAALSRKYGLVDLDADRLLFSGARVCLDDDAQRLFCGRCVSGRTAGRNERRRTAVGANPHLRLKLSVTKVVDTMVGEQAILVDDLPPAGLGKAEMRGSMWNARNIGETELRRGQRATVERVEGLVLLVRA